MFKSPGSIAFEIGSIAIHWYGIIIALAFLTGLLLVTKIAKIQNEKVDHVIDLSIYLLIGAILGSRLYYVAFNLEYYSHNLEEIFMLWQGGLSIHGGILGGFIVGVIYTKIYKLSLLKYADMFSYGMILGQAIGRWGNFFNSEAFGSPTNLPWKVFIPLNSRPAEYIGYDYFHPTFLYESLWNFSVFFVLFFVLREKLKNYNGAIFFSYLTLYSLGRFIIEGIRVDNIYSVFGLPIAQFVSILLIITGIAGFCFVKVCTKRLDSD